MSVCEMNVCEMSVCEMSVCEMRRRRRKEEEAAGAELKTKTPHKDVGKNWLVVEPTPSEKYMSSSVGMMKFHQPAGVIKHG